MSLNDMHKELGIGICKLRNYMKDEQLLVPMKVSRGIQARNAKRNKNQQQLETMSYRKELDVKLKSIKTRLKNVNATIIVKQKKREDITELLQERNILSVDQKTIESRIFNLGKDVYLLPTFSINN